MNLTSHIARQSVCVHTLPPVVLLCAHVYFQTGCDSRPPGTGWTILRQAGRAQQGRATGRGEASE